MQSAGTGAEIYIGGLAGFLGAAIPQTSAAVDALFPVKLGHAAFAAGNRLPGTHFHAKLRFAVLADIRAKERDMIGIARRGLHASACQQGVLVGDKQLAIEWNFGPATTVHDLIVKRQAAPGGFVL